MHSDEHNVVIFHCICENCCVEVKEKELIMFCRVFIVKLRKNCVVDLCAEGKCSHENCVRFH